MVSASCSLDETGLSTQLSRYRAAGEGAEIIEKRARRLVIRVSGQTSDALIEELVAVERSCCPFFDLRWEPGTRDLTVAVARQEDEPALGAIGDALGLSDSGRGTARWCY
jgi:hypothetical protein